MILQEELSGCRNRPHSRTFTNFRIGPVKHLEKLNGSSIIWVWSLGNLEKVLSRSGLKQRFFTVMPATSDWLNESKLLNFAIHLSGLIALESILFASQWNFVSYRLFRSTIAAERAAGWIKNKQGPLRWVGCHQWSTNLKGVNWRRYTENEVDSYIDERDWAYELGSVLPNTMTKLTLTIIISLVKFGDLNQWKIL